MIVRRDCTHSDQCGRDENSCQINHIKKRRTVGDKRIALDQLTRPAMVIKREHWRQKLEPPAIVIRTIEPRVPPSPEKPLREFLGRPSRTRAQPWRSGPRRYSERAPAALVHVERATAFDGPMRPSILAHSCRFSCRFRFGGLYHSAFADCE